LSSLFISILLSVLIFYVFVSLSSVSPSWCCKTHILGIHIANTQQAWVAEPFSKWGGTSARQKNYRQFCGVSWQLWRHKHWNITPLPIHHMKVKITLF